MPRYPNSECDAHRNVKTSAPVCIVCMDEELTRLRKLAQASLDARDKEADAALRAELTTPNVQDHRPCAPLAQGPRGSQS